MKPLLRGAALAALIVAGAPVLAQSQIATSGNAVSNPTLRPLPPRVSAYPTADWSTPGFTAGSVPPASLVAQSDQIAQPTTGNTGTSTPRAGAGNQGTSGTDQGTSGTAASPGANSSDQMTSGQMRRHGSAARHHNQTMTQGRTQQDDTAEELNRQELQRVTQGNR